MPIPFFRPDLGAEEREAVDAVLRSGWLTTGEQCHAFEQEFAKYVGARHAVALNSCTAALHLALEAVGIQPGDRVLVPTMTFAATAEVVRYLDAVPVLVDCNPVTLNLDLMDAGRRLDVAMAAGSRVRAIMPMHYAGQPLDMEAVRDFAQAHDLKIVEDAAHALPAMYLNGGWHRIGAGTADATCFSFYANKTLTTGEGGMLVTDDPTVADRVRMMSLHGISKDAWRRYTAQGSWYYEILAPGFKYNLTDIAAALGRVQLRRCELLAAHRQRLAARYDGQLSAIAEIERPMELTTRHSAWHLYVIQLELDYLTIDRAEFINRMRARGVQCSVAWMPLHLHPYYRETYGYRPEDYPVANAVWPRIVSLPLYPSMTDAEQDEVVAAVRAVIAEARK